MCAILLNVNPVSLEYMFLGRDFYDVFTVLEDKYLTCDTPAVLLSKYLCLSVVESVRLDALCSFHGNNATCLA